MTQAEQDAIASETMAWIRDIGRQLKRQEAKIDERNGRMSAQQHLAALGLKYLTADWSGWLYARDVEPIKAPYCWTDLDGYAFAQRFIAHKSRAGSLADLVSWDDPEPLDIIQTLKDNNVEV